MRPGPAAHDDRCLVTDDTGRIRHELIAEALNQLWLSDIAEYRTGEGKLYRCDHGRLVQSDRRLLDGLPDEVPDRGRRLNGAVARRGVVAG